MMKKLLVLAGIGVAVALVARKIKTTIHDREVWHEATTTAPDLR